MGNAKPKTICDLKNIIYIKFAQNDNQCAQKSVFTTSFLNIDYNYAYVIR